MTWLQNSRSYPIWMYQAIFLRKKLASTWIFITFLHSWLDTWTMTIYHHNEYKKKNDHWKKTYLWTINHRIMYVYKKENQSYQLILVFGSIKNLCKYLLREVWKTKHFLSTYYNNILRVSTLHEIFNIFFEMKNITNYKC